MSSFKVLSVCFPLEIAGSLAPAPLFTVVTIIGIIALLTIIIRGIMLFKCKAASYPALDKDVNEFILFAYPWILVWAFYYVAGSRDGISFFWISGLVLGTTLVLSNHIKPKR